MTTLDEDARAMALVRAQGRAEELFDEIARRGLVARSYITTGNGHAMHEAVDTSGRRCHWILEVHLVDSERRIGGFTEQLLTLHTP